MLPKLFLLSLTIGTLLLVCSISANNTQYAYKLTYINYTVQSTDKSLWSIAERYATTNVCLDEYAELILKNNYDSLFYAREQQGQRGMIRVGDVLRIPVWEVEK